MKHDGSMIINNVSDFPNDTTQFSLVSFMGWSDCIRFHYYDSKKYTIAANLGIWKLWILDVIQFTLRTRKCKFWMVKYVPKTDWIKENCDVI